MVRFASGLFLKSIMPSGSVLISKTRPDKLCALSLTWFFVFGQKRGERGLFRDFVLQNPKQAGLRIEYLQVFNLE